MASISAHDTTWGQMASTLDLIVSITSKPRIELLFGAAVFSPVNVGVSSSSTDPSQPCNDFFELLHRNCTPFFFASNILAHFCDEI